jgi:hypothetical protein
MIVFGDQEGSDSGRDPWNIYTQDSIRCCLPGPDPVDLPYQPLTASTFLSEQSPPVSSTFFSQQITLANYRPNEVAEVHGRLGVVDPKQIGRLGVHGRRSTRRCVTSSIPWRPQASTTILFPLSWKSNEYFSKMSNNVGWFNGTLPTRVQIPVLAPFLMIFSGFTGVMR